MPLVFAALAAAPAAGAQAPVPTAPPTAAAPSCHTVDASGQPATLFAPGDRLVVQGEGFGLVSAIRITFVQGSRTLPIAVAYSDELGVFSTAKTVSRVPATAAPGPASIHAFSTTKVTTCAVQVMAAAGGSAASPKPHKKRSLLVVAWWALLVAFGLFLVVVLIRRWRGRRLASKVEQAAPVEAPAGVPLLAGSDDDEVVLEEAPSPLPSPEHERAQDTTSLLAPVIDERPTGTPAPPPLGAPPPPADHEDAVLDLLPEGEDLPEPHAVLPAEPEASPRTQGGDDLDEFVYEDGRWRLRDDMRERPAHPSGVDVDDARAVADALHVPDAPARPDDEPPLLDPTPVADQPEHDAPPAPPVDTAPPAVEGTVSDTVARLVENTKDWTKR